MRKLGKTIGIYGDSFSVRPFKSWDSKGIVQSPPSHRDSRYIDSDIIDLRYCYLRDNREFAVPEDSLVKNTSWWIHQVGKLFDNMIHSGYGGSSVEHMLYTQIDVNNDFEYSFPNDPLAKNIVPDVMICLWTNPWRFYLDPFNRDFINELGLGYDDIRDLNQIGAPNQTYFNGRNNLIERLKNYKYKSLHSKIKNIVEISSSFLVYQRKLSYKVMFDAYWSQKLKERNPKCKIIHIDCFNDYEQVIGGENNQKNLHSMKNNLPLKNNLWINNFYLEFFHHPDDQPDRADHVYDNFVGHIPKQKDHDFIANKLIEWIENYDDLVGNFDFSDWKSEYDML